MKLFNFLKRHKEEDDEEEDDFDDDGPRTQVIDDDTELAALSEGPDFSSASDDIIADSEIDDSPDDLASDEASTDPFDADDAAPIPDFDDDDIDFDEDDGDHRDASEEGGRSPLLFIIAGVAVLIIGVIGGAGFWFLGGQDQTTAEATPPQASNAAVVMPIAPPNPSPGGGLNAIGKAGLSPSAAPETTTEATATSETAGSSPETGAPAAEVMQTAEQKREKALASITGVGAGGSLNAAFGGIPHDSGQGLVIPSVTSVSYEKWPDQERVIPLANAPDPSLVQPVDGLPNPLPVIGQDGRQPWQVYARPFVEQTANPKVAIIVKGLGFSRAASMAAIKKLPGEVTLAFSPYASDLNDWMLRARLSGHEVLLELPMESKNFPTEDAGPLALRTTMQVADNIRQLNTVMSRMTGYIGLLSVMGSKFNEAEGQLKPILSEVKKRGLLFVDGGGSTSRARRIAAEIDLPRTFSNVYLDQPPNRREMDRKLQGLDQLVREQAAAVAIIDAYPNTIERILIWIKTMEQRKLTLVPVSELANKQFIQ